MARSDSSGRSGSKPRSKSRSRSKSPARKPEEDAKQSDRKSPSKRSPEKRSGSRDRSGSPSHKEPVADGTVLHVNNLTRNVSAKHLEEIFGHYGTIKRVELAMDRRLNLPRGFAYVDFASRAEAEKAMDGMNAGQIDGNKLAIQFVELPSRRQSPPRASRDAPRRRSPVRGGRSPPRRGRSPPRGGRGRSPPRGCLLYTSPSPRDRTRSRMPSSA
eukprot:TRINITY_DN24349_c0_g2_i1.p1 TRINITY_DN24349_c0_g2~~TRINITY_DN24349_c0_g2_i1.p1  ORF type:complete len:215 (-),score=40.89 TRINITY_DN24349_c0_g2_i1:54-698(-)